MKTVILEGELPEEFVSVMLIQHNYYTEVELALKEETKALGFTVRKGELEWAGISSLVSGCRIAVPSEMKLCSIQDTVQVVYPTKLNQDDAEKVVDNLKLRFESLLRNNIERLIDIAKSTLAIKISITSKERKTRARVEETFLTKNSLPRPSLIHITDSQVEAYYLTKFDDEWFPVMKIYLSELGDVKISIEERE